MESILLEFLGGRLLDWLPGWLGQPVAYGVMAYRTAIEKHTTTDHIPPFQMALTPAAIAAIENERKQPQGQQHYTMNATGFFDSKLGSFEVQLNGFPADVQA